MDYHFRIYYLTKDNEIIKRIKNKFSTYATVNGESYIITDEQGALLLEETEKRGFIRIRTKRIEDLRSFEH